MHKIDEITLTLLNRLPTLEIDQNRECEIRSRVEEILLENPKDSTEDVIHKVAHSFGLLDFDPPLYHNQG